MTIKIDKEKFIKLAKNNNRHAVAKHFSFCDMTAQRIADKLGVKFKKYKPTGRKSIYKID